MVLHHVPQLTDTIVVGPTPFDTDLFSNRDLHVIDTALIHSEFTKRLANRSTSRF